MNLVKKVSLTLRTAVIGQSTSGGQGYQKCNCSGGRKKCTTNRCSCYKAKLQCNSRCHGSLTNKKTIFFLIFHIFAQHFFHVLASFMSKPKFLYFVYFLKRKFVQLFIKAAFHPYVNNLCFVLNLVLSFSVPHLLWYDICLLFLIFRL